VTNDVAQRRRRRAAAQQIFDAIAIEYFDLPEISRGAMFGSNGLRCLDRFFAFVGRDGDLVVKLPAAHAAGLVAEGQAAAIRAGGHTTREWVGIPNRDGDDSPQGWREFIAASHRYVSMLRPSSGQ